MHDAQPYRRALTTSNFTIRTLRLGRRTFGQLCSSRHYRLKLIHPAQIRRSISGDRFGLSVTVSPK